MIVKFNQIQVQKDNFLNSPKTRHYNCKACHRALRDMGEVKGVPVLALPYSVHQQEVSDEN